MNLDSYDVVIVGCGAGASILALVLGQTGQRVLIVERNEGPSRNGADVLKPPAIKIMEEYGLLDKLVERDARVRDSLEVFHDGKQVSLIEYGKNDLGDFFLLVPYFVLVTTVVDQLKKLPTVELCFNTTIDSVEKDGGFVKSMTLSDGRQVSAPVVVGADGARSFMRDVAGIKVERTVYTQAMYYARLPLTPGVEEQNRLYLGSQNCLAYFYPVNHKECMVVLGLEKSDGDALREKDEKALTDRLREFVSESDDILGEVGSLSGFVAVPVSMMDSEEYYRDNIVLIGDAIHSVHPVTGQGMNLSIEDGACLGHHLLEKFQNGSPLSHTMKSYQDERKPINSAIVSYGHKLATAFVNGRKFVEILDPSLQGASRNFVAAA